MTTTISRPNRLVTRVLLVCCIVGLAGCSGSRSDHSASTVAEEALRSGAPALALQVTQGILARTPDDVAALVLQGDAQTQLGQINEAATAYTHALRLQPNSVRGKMGLGRLRLGTDLAEAISLFQDVLKQEPRNIQALNNIGIARDLMGQHAEAQQAYRQVHAIDPTNIAAQVNMALSMAMSGNATEALPLIAPLAIDASASPKLRHDYAVVLTMAGKTNEAEQILGHDMSPAEVKQVLEAIREQRTNAN